MKSFKCLFVLLFSLVATAAFASSAATAAKLFVVSANHAKVMKADGSYVLKLKNPKVSYFTDRPARAAGALTVKEFVSGWGAGKNSFAKDNPNAAFVVDEHMRHNDKFVSLSSPKYNAKNQVLTFKVTGIDKQVTLTPGKYHNAVLFIDNSCNIHHYSRNCL